MIHTEIVLESYKNDKFKFSEKYKLIPKYDFSNLENDLILSELGGNSVEEIIKDALIKYSI